jgi:retinol dehydrogenase 12
MRDLEGRTFLVTGANSGIGQVTAGVLAGRGADVFVACRSREIAEATEAALRAQADGTTVSIHALAIDLADLDSVRAAAAAFVAHRRPLHGLVNNAGVAATKLVTRQHLEMSFGVNHLGHFLLTRLLEGPLRAGAPARVVNVASEAHRQAAGIDFAALRAPGRSMTGVPEYAVSKLCNILFTRELARRWAGSGVTTYAVHPGVVATRIWRRVPQPLRWLGTRFMLSPEEGARASIRCATAPELGTTSGRYYIREREADPSRIAQDDALASRLWEESEKLAGF